MRDEIVHPVGEDLGGALGESRVDPALLGHRTRDGGKAGRIGRIVTICLPHQNTKPSRPEFSNTQRTSAGRLCPVKMNGHLNFNGELLELDDELWDYVIVHELLHFSVPNHGKLWKSLMRVHLGDYEKLEDCLRTATNRV